MDSLNDTQETDDKPDTSRSSTSEDAIASPRSNNTRKNVPYALHIDVNNKENEKGEKTTTKNVRSATEQSMSTTAAKKPRTPTTENPPLRAPYAQPVLDASKLHNGKSTTEDRLASARGRRLQQQKQIELDLKTRREREEQGYAKWMQDKEDKRRKIEENKMKDDVHRRGVELRKKQQSEEDKKKTEAKIARTDQVYEVKLRQKRGTSSDRGSRQRWSWGAGADDPPEQMKSGSLSNLASPLSSKTGGERFSKSPLIINSTHMTFASGLRSYEATGSAGRGLSPDSPRLRRSNSLGSRPKKTDNGPPVRTASMENIAPKIKDQETQKTPNTRGRSPSPKVTLTTTSKIREQLAKNQKGRPHTSPGLTEPITISPRLLAPTRASLARSRNTVNDLEDSISLSSAGSGSHGPMRSRSKDRRIKESQSGRSDSGSSSPRVDSSKSTPPMRKPTPERKTTPSRGSSPMVASRRAPSPAKKTNTASNGLDNKLSAAKSTSDVSKVQKRGNSPQPRSYRAPSPASKSKSTTDLSTPPRSSPRRGASPSPASRSKVQNDSKPVSTPPNIKPSLRPMMSTQIKTKSSPSTKNTPPSKTTKPATTIPKKETTKQAQKPEEVGEKIINKSDSDSGFQDASKSSSLPPRYNSGVMLTPSTSSEIPKSLSNTSQAVSDIPTSEIEDSHIIQAPPGKVDAGKDNNIVSNLEEAHNDDVEITSNVIQDNTRHLSLDQDASSTTKDGNNLILNNNSQSESSLDVKDNSPQLLGEMKNSKPAVELNLEQEKVQESLLEVNQESSQDKDVKSPQMGGETDPIKTFVDAENAQDNQWVPELEDDTAKDSLEAMDVNAEQRDSLLDSFQTVEPIDPRAVSPTDSLDDYEPVNDLSTDINLQNELDSADCPPADNFDSEESESEEQVSVKERIPNQELPVDTPASELVEDLSENLSPDQTREENRDTSGQLSEGSQFTGQLPKEDSQQAEDVPTSTDEILKITQQEDDTAEEVPLGTKIQATVLEESGVEDAPPASEILQLTKKEECGTEVFLPGSETQLTVQEENQEELVEIATDKVEIPQKEDEEPMEKNTRSLVNLESQETTMIENVPVPTDELQKNTAPNEEADNKAVRVEEEKAEKAADETTTVTVETAPVNERKSMPRKNLETDEEKEAYRQVIAEKRRELKEKKEQEAKERQERMRLAKIEQAKREEEARRMFKEAEASAENDRKMREEEEKRMEEEEKRKEKMMEEEEKRKEEESNAQKREAAEKVKRDREAQKQKQEDERMARKKRLEMIMRRTRQPDASDSDRTKTDGSLTPSPLNTPITQSPTSGRSPQAQSPVEGKSPLNATTPERSASPAVAAILNRSNETGSISPIMISESSTENSPLKNNDSDDTNAMGDNDEHGLLNFSNSTQNIDSGVELIKIDDDEKEIDTNIEKPRSFEAFTVKPIANGVTSEPEDYSNIKDPFNLFSNGDDHQQSTVNQDLLSINNDLIQQKTESLVPTGI